MYALDEVQAEIQNPKFKIPQGLIELSFIKATRFDDTIGLRSAMQRQELIEFLLRLAKSWVNQVYSSKVNLCDHLQEFIDTYMKPISDKVDIAGPRKLIHSSERLNEFLFDNKKCLEELYKEFKLSKQFCMDSAFNFSHPL